MLEISNRGDIYMVQKDIKMIKDFFTKLEMQFPGQQVPDAIEINTEISGILDEIGKAEGD